MAGFSQARLRLRPVASVAVLVTTGRDRISPFLLNATSTGFFLAYYRERKSRRTGSTRSTRSSAVTWLQPKISQ